MSAFWVRPARPADLKAVRELARRVSREYRLAVKATGRQEPSDVANLLWVVEAGRGEIVGSCGAREGAGGVWELHSLFLAPQWRGIGLGRALVEQAIRSAEREGALRLACSVPAELPEAEALLRRLGFVAEAAQNPGLERFVKPLRQIS
ncbi:MAG: GNAT family N-acetyltransferase [Thermoanaerobaculales bacterium]